MPTRRKYRTTELSATEKERLRKVYADRSVTVATISGRFGICPDKITETAMQEGWPLRRAQTAKMKVKHQVTEARV